MFLSAADTELASLAQAHRLAPDLPSLRLANFLTLTHPMSVDAYVERTARYASLIVVRIIGGETYWPYGLEALHACAVNHGIKIAVLPGMISRTTGWTGFRRSLSRSEMNSGSI